MDYFTFRFRALIKTVTTVVLSTSLLFVDIASSQNKVVVIPLGSDVSAKQFNDLVEQVNQAHVFSGLVESNGEKGGFGHYVSSREAEGTYTVNVFPLPDFEIKEFGEPSITITSQNTHRIAMVSEVGLGHPVSGNVSQLAFKVTLRTHFGDLSDASFYFHVQFGQFSSQIDGPSDRRLKANVEKIGETSDGLNLYQFSYKDDPAKSIFVGVMAQEILVSHPSAVSKAEDGYYKVDYFKLGLRMATMDNWGKFGLGAVEMRYPIGQDRTEDIVVLKEIENRDVTTFNVNTIQGN